MVEERQANKANKHNYRHSKPQFASEMELTFTSDLLPLLNMFSLLGCPFWREKQSLSVPGRNVEQQYLE